ncbi:SF1B family DNA helicase RecD2 [Geomonas subterranea]|uniref:SF1B family DNA helicase RecD2 n=1 Tax=Geomonas subterranea TaxID=2847989 RepID=UPI001CD76654|nr:AAA family ATPase [Geomonas fuzhouensis]
MPTITATIDNIIFESADTGYYILALLLPDKTGVVARGNAIFPTSPVGSRFVFDGEWVTHPKHGRQFEFRKCEPEGGELLFFLARVVKGLGDALAHAVIRRFGGDTERIIEEEPQRLLEIKGIGEKKLEKVLESFHKFLPVRQLFALLSPHGVTNAMVVKIFNALGDDAVTRVKANPYSLTEISGIGYKKADQIAIATGEDVDSPRRIGECVKFVMNQTADGSGDTVVPNRSVIDAVLEETSTESHEQTVARDQVEAQIQTMIEDGIMVQYKGGVALKALAFYERKIVEIIAQRSAIPKGPLMGAEELAATIATIERDMGFHLVEEQRAAVELVASGETTVVVCGYAGTGKTSTSKVMLGVLAKIFGQDEIVCMALSGMAASRVRKLSGFESGTIHSILKFKGNDSEYGPDNPLPFKVCLLDENSMNNSWLFYKVLAALDKNTILIMLGDPAQLPPIGSGDPFADIIAHRLCPVAALTKIHRQEAGSVLVGMANTIRQGRVPDGYKAKGYKDFFFIDKSIPNWFQLRRTAPQSELDRLRDLNNQDIVDYIRRCCERLKPQLENIVTDFQVLSPIRKGALGVDALNAAVQDVMNPPEGQAEMERFGVIFREGDKVVHTQNKNMPVCTAPMYLDDPDGADFSGDARIFNGSVGLIQKVDLEEERVDVLYPSIKTVVRYEFSQMKDIIDLAWVLTVHKSQGSEYGTVIIPVSAAAFTMMTNKLLYTAITRARERVLLVGQSYMFERACKNLDETKRKTVIQELMALVDEE